MSKTIKKIATIALALMVLISTVPTAFAADGSFTVQCSKLGYTFETFKIATRDQSGAYTAVATDADIVAELAKDLSSTADLLAACDKVTNYATLGTSLGSWLTLGADKTFSGLDDGIYYVKCTGTPVADAIILSNSIVTVPGTTSFSVDRKVKDGSTPDAYLSFGDGTQADKSVGTGDTISYTITADITGTPSNKTEKYILNAKLDASLDKNAVSINSVKAVKGTNKVDLAYNKLDNASGNTFSVEIKASEINSDAFYGYKQVVVEFSTKLTSDAIVGSKINCHSSMIYKFANQPEATVEGETVSVTTYEISVSMVDPTDTSKKLSGAAFAVYSDDACTTQLATATSGADGTAKFAYKFAKGTYYIKLLSAPNGYNLNTTVFQVVVDGSSSVTPVNIATTPTAMPQTGGAGTAFFTVTGASLIAIAAVLFILVIKKKKLAK